uniref:Hint domain-containing protein n=1 Tax=Alexandrium catenella TaxID=2925 RepID=A0A7S1RMK8_ALECA
MVNAVGFAARGVTANSAAARMMAVEALSNGGGVAAGSSVAVLQSAGARGLLSFAGGLGGAATGAAIAGVVTYAFNTVTGFEGSGLPNGQDRDPGDVTKWLLVTEEGFFKVQYYQFPNEQEARSAFNQLTMPRVLYDPPRFEVDWGGHPLGCNTIRGHKTEKSSSFVPGAWMVLTENGPGNVIFYPFESEARAAAFYDSFFMSKPRILIDPTMEESRSGGLNPAALFTLRKRVAEASAEMVSSDTAQSLTSIEGPRCFVPGTLLSSPSGLLVPVERLGTGYRIRSSKGNDLCVMRCVVHWASDQEPAQLVEIAAGPAAITVTASHRILTQGGISVQAADLRKGHIVLISGDTPATVTHVRAFAEPLDVYELTFTPDEAIEAFVQPPVQILCMGEASSLGSAGPTQKTRTRRSGQNRRQERQRQAAADSLSIPDTHDSWR